MKTTICTTIGMVGGCIASLFGGWDAALVTLLIQPFLTVIVSRT